MSAHPLACVTHPITVELATVHRVIEEILNEVKIRNFLSHDAAMKAESEVKHLGGPFAIVKRESVTCIVVDTPRGPSYYEVSKPLEIMEEKEKTKKALMEKVASAGLTKEDLEAALKALKER